MEPSSASPPVVHPGVPLAVERHHVVVIPGGPQPLSYVDGGTGLIDARTKSER
jgi:hypothetical protein